jgi:hypothetical protein
MTPIATESLVASDPLAVAASDYACAELTIIYHRRQKRRTLLLAVLELLTPWMEPAAEVPTEPAFADKSSFCKLRGGSENEINLRRVILSVPDALAWYNRCRAGTVTLPPTAASSNKVAQQLIASVLEEEPPLPAMSLAVDDASWSDAHFWGFRPGGHRHHQLIAATPPALASWAENETEQESARRWLADAIHVDLFKAKSLWGSVHLLLTNPLFGHVHVHSPTKRTDTLLVEVTLQPGASLQGLELTFSEHRPGGPTKLAHRRLTSPTTELVIGHEVLAGALALTCPARGLLYAQEIGPTLRRTSIAVDLITGTREVYVDARAPGDPGVYRTPLVRGAEVVHVGDTARRTSSALRLLAEQREAKRRGLARRLGQRVFRANMVEATEVVRGLLARARRTVLIFDPYFSAQDLGRYVLANGNPKVSFRIATSALQREGADASRGDPLEELDAALRQIAHPTTSPIELRVRPGKTVFHDRYIIIDEAVWLLGSSLNKYGDRMTTMIELPDPEALAGALEAEWAVTRDLATYLAERRVAREEEARREDAARPKGARAALLVAADWIADGIRRVALLGHGGAR